MMRTTPWRRTTLQLRQIFLRTTLQLRQIFLTDAPTFMIKLRVLQAQDTALACWLSLLTPVIPEIGLAH